MENDKSFWIFLKRLRAKEKLENNFGSEKCIRLKKLSTLTGCRKLRHGRTFSCSGSSTSLAPREWGVWRIDEIKLESDCTGEVGRSRRTRFRGTGVLREIRQTTSNH